MTRTSLPRNRLRTIQSPVMLTADEYRRYRKFADDAGLPLAACFRQGLDALILRSRRERTSAWERLEI